MKLTKVVGLTALAVVISACAPRNDALYLDINEALNSAEAKEVLDPSVKLYFGKPAPGKVVRKGITTNPKTNAANKSDQDACRWAFLSAVKKFQDRAKSEGARKVGNLVSYYKKKEYRSTTKYECHAGNLMAGVALKGDIVR